MSENNNIIERKAPIKLLNLTYLWAAYIYSLVSPIHGKYEKADYHFLRNGIYIISSYKNK